MSNKGERKIQCTACRHLHTVEERIEKRKKDMTALCCPVCRGAVYWMILKEPIGKRKKAMSFSEWEESYTERSVQK